MVFSREINQRSGFTEQIFGNPEETVCELSELIDWILCQEFFSFDEAQNLVLVIKQKNLLFDKIDIVAGISSKSMRLELTLVRAFILSADHYF